ncbi:MAG: DedA family protein [Firmicutes bacterium]|nr:DedA family protein [Bacillota bacterium]
MNEAAITDTLIRYFSSYGYFVIFAVLFLENLFLLGLLIPGETVLILGAAFAAQSQLNIFYVIATAVIAAIAGNIAGYFIGRKGGRPLLEKVGERFSEGFWGRFISPEKIKAAEQYFDLHGTKTVFIGRFAAGLRTFIPLLAGAAKMDFPKFLAYTAAAVITWTVGLGLVGFFFGRNWPLIKKLFSRFSILILILIIIFVIYYVVRRSREKAID